MDGESTSIGGLLFYCCVFRSRLKSMVGAEQAGERF